MSRFVAIHEAGHAVIGRVLGLSCGKVTVEPEPPRRAIWSESGELIVAHKDGPDAHAEIWRRWSPWDSGTQKQLDQAYVVMTLAGAEAERVLCGTVEPGIDAGDLRIATRVIGNNPERLAKLRRKANALVRKHAVDIEKVATALLERGTLYDLQVSRLLLGWTDKEVWAGRRL